MALNEVIKYKSSAGSPAQNDIPNGGFVTSKDDDTVYAKSNDVLIPLAKGSDVNTAESNANAYTDTNAVSVTSEVLVSGQDWDGIEYTDSGLQGVPDTSFSPTGARIYPDGTIRGKSSYGEYVKYPDGTCRVSVNTELAVNNSHIGNIYISNTNTPVVLINIGEATNISGEGASIGSYPYITTYTSRYTEYFSITYANAYDGVARTGSFGLVVSFDGEWK